LHRLHKMVSQKQGESCVAKRLAGISSNRIHATPSTRLPEIREDQGQQNEEPPYGGTFHYATAPTSGWWPSHLEQEWFFVLIHLHAECKRHLLGVCPLGRTCSHNKVRCPHGPCMKQQINQPHDFYPQGRMRKLPSTPDTSTLFLPLSPSFFLSLSRTRIFSSSFSLSLFLFLSPSLYLFIRHPRNPKGAADRKSPPSHT
jgi:hypothetical protein